MTEHVEYVVGFCFDPTLLQVVLVRKNRPEWQKGRLNGVGGKIEPSDADPLAAMEREFTEETGVSDVGWQKFGALSGVGWTVHLFCATDDRYNQVATKTDEEVGVYQSFEIPWMTTLTNIRWLVPLAHDFLRADGRGPAFAAATYTHG
jgi:8-oxo-dGTP diphosphatase